MTFIFVGGELADAWSSINQRECDLQSISGRFSECLRSVSETALAGEEITPALQNYVKQLEKDVISVFENVTTSASVRERIDYLDKLDETIY